jgi:putative ABC transport system permease protein
VTGSRRVRRWVEDGGQDLRYAWRSLARHPGFASVAVLTLALGIGANTAIFSVVHAVLVRPPAYAKDSGRLVRLIMNLPPAASPTGGPLRTFVPLSAREAADLRQRSRTLADAAIAGPELAGLRGIEGGARLTGARVSASAFAMLGARPIAGRLIEPRDEAPGAEPVILLSFAAWQQFFGGDSHVVGNQVTLDSALGPRRERRAIVIGVMPPTFTFPSSGTRFWTAVAPPPAGAANAANLSRAPLLAVLADGYSPQAAAAELAAIVRQIRQDKPGVTYDVVREQDEQVAAVRPALIVLAVAVGFVLLIACVNVANLLLARMNARQREIAVRTALGAGQGRLLRQTLSESVVLAFLGGVAGIVLAFALLQLLRVMLGRCCCASTS